MFALRLSQYARCLVMDADVLALKPMDALFFRREALVIANHPTDTSQGQCRLSQQRRGVGAFYVLRPSEADFQQLFRALGRQTAWQKRHYFEQLGIACHFANRSHTLPCAYVYDVGNFERPVNAKECLKHINETMRYSCLRRPAWSCVPSLEQGRQECEAMQRHLHTRCAWDAHSGRVHAVHFKGSMKPWLAAERCHQVRNGRFVLQHEGAALGGANRTTHAQHDVPLEWDWRLQSCRTSAASGRLRVRYAGSALSTVHRKCCNAYSLLAAEWYASQRRLLVSLAR